MLYAYDHVTSILVLAECLALGDLGGAAMASKSRGVGLDFSRRNEEVIDRPVTSDCWPLAGCWRIGTDGNTSLSPRNLVPSPISLPFPVVNVVIQLTRCFAGARICS